jgi:predicted component of type VI protein secretion system
MAAQFQFVMRSGPNTGKVYPLETPEIIIGRDATNNIPINDAEVSRKHAKLILQSSAYVIQDLGSTNGTFINGQRITASQVLKPGDKVTLGENIVLMYEVAFDPNATLISSAKAPKTIPPIQKPIPTPAPPSTAPVQVFVDQVPAGPTPKATAPAKRGSRKVIVIILIVLLVCLILACIAFLFWVDSKSRWCTFPLNFIVNFIGQFFGRGCS